jgi:hypothetical protein
MIQLTESDGRAYPLAFDWADEDGAVSRVKIEKVFSYTPCAEQKSGVVGDRYECLIRGRREYLYYSLIAPRKWFKLKPVTEDEYKTYYRLPGEIPGEPKLRRPRGMKIAEDPADYGADVDLSPDTDPGAGMKFAGRGGSGGGADRGPGRDMNPGGRAGARACGGGGANPGAVLGADLNYDMGADPDADLDAASHVDMGKLIYMQKNMHFRVW